MKQFIILICMLTSTCMYPQVGIGTTRPDTSAVLDVCSTSKGILIPRLFKQQLNSIKTPANGLIVYVIDAHVEWFYINGLSFPYYYGRLWVYDGAFWTEIPAIVKR